MAHTDTADRTAAEAVVAHHAELADTLDGYARALLQAAERDDAPRLWQHREALVTWLHGELLPHAYAEEAALYPVAAARPAGRLLVEGCRPSTPRSAAWSTRWRTRRPPWPWRPRRGPSRPSSRST
ncbi:hemerythrin domain-containing protein [Luedemannella flava]